MTPVIRVACAAALFIVGGPPLTAYSDTILKLHINGSGNIGFSNGVLSAVDDGIAESNGIRNAVLEFPQAATTITSLAAPSSASFTLADMTAVSPASVFSNSLVVQNLVGGRLDIFGLDNSLLLSADLSTSAITGPLGPASTQGLYLAFGKITGGSMAAGLDPESLRVRMKLPTVAGGFVVDPSPLQLLSANYQGSLSPFLAMTELIEIQAEPGIIPEPATTTLSGMAALALCAMLRRRSSR